MKLLIVRDTWHQVHYLSKADWESTEAKLCLRKSDGTPFNKIPPRLRHQGSPYIFREHVKAIESECEAKPI
jgi:hypothetical protein